MSSNFPEGQCQECGAPASNSLLCDKHFKEKMDRTCRKCFNECPTGQEICEECKQAEINGGYKPSKHRKPTNITPKKKSRK